MKQSAGKFSFKVPEGHSDAGKKIDKAFEYQECETLAEAQDILAKKEWNVVEMVNDQLKANARASAYQTALLPYRPTEKSVEEIVEGMVRGYIRIGWSEEKARKHVTASLEAAALEEATATEVDA